MRPLATELGFWRPVEDGEVELLLAHPTGIVELYYGKAEPAKIELRTDGVLRSPHAKEYNAATRLYGLVNSNLHVGHGHGRRRPGAAEPRLRRAQARRLRPGMSATPARILTVCTGNICRSPFLERALQAELDRSWGSGAVEVSSGGTGALAGASMEDQARAYLESNGYAADGFVARAARPPRWSPTADLVLTATRAHRGKVAALHPQGPALRLLVPRVRRPRGGPGRRRPDRRQSRDGGGRGRRPPARGRHGRQGPAWNTRALARR